MIKTITSKHANERIDERISMCVDELLELIEAKKAIDYGFQNKSHRKFWIFYSVQDMDCFAAIRDEVNKIIITVLPLEYLTREVPDSVKIYARLLSDMSYNENTYTSTRDYPYTKLSDFELSGIFFNPDTGHYNSINFGSFYKPFYGETLNEIKKNPHLRDNIQETVKEKQLDITNFQKFLVRLNSWDKDFDRINLRLPQQYFTTIT